jgi:RNA polymerase sigma-70 factor (ECF subfamily)
VYAFVRFRTADQPTAEDIAAEVFARAWSKLHDPSDPDAAAAWLFTTARRLVIDHYRRTTRPISLETVSDSAHAWGLAPETAAVASERLATLARSMTDLSEREREVIGLRFIARLRHRQIASLVGTSEGNVAKILHRALQKLRDRLATEGYTASDGLEGVMK